MIPLSVLDLSPISAGAGASQALRHTLELAQLADRLGYHRYWVAEHHNIASVASTAPEIMIAEIAARTERIRVGSGGIMLPNHAPLRIAENFHVLEAMHPGRIDLGLGRAPGSDQLTALALRGSKDRLVVDKFPEQLAQLIGLSTGGLPSSHPFSQIRVIPEDAALPPLWILGSSTDGAQLAAEFGVGFAFAHHINPDLTQLALELYRDRFKASRWLDRPRTIVTASVVCASSDAAAARLATTLELNWIRLRTGRPAPLTSPAEAAVYPYTPVEQQAVHATRRFYFAGSPATIREKLINHVQRTRADELMIMTSVYDQGDRLRSYELVWDALNAD